MDNDNTKDPLSDMTEKISRNILGAKIAAVDLGRGPDSLTIQMGDGILSQISTIPTFQYTVYTPKIGDVFAHVVNGKISCIVLCIDDEKAIYNKFEEIDLAKGNIEEVYLSMYVTELPGLFSVYSFLDTNRGGTYIRVTPDLWAKAMKYHNIYIASLNAITSTIDPYEPFNS